VLRRCCLDRVRLDGLRPSTRVGAVPRSAVVGTAVVTAVEKWNPRRAITELVETVDATVSEWQHGRQEQAACRGADDASNWFSFDETKGKAAQAVCRRCPVRIECGTFAIAFPQYGIWGGTTEEERLPIRRSPRRREYLFGQLRQRAARTAQQGSGVGQLGTTRLGGSMFERRQEQLIYMVIGATLLLGFELATGIIL
jgi:hypothetical protein